MDNRSDQPLIRLIGRSGGQAGGIVVSAHRSRRLRRGLMAMIRNLLALGRRLGKIVRMFTPKPSDDLLSYVPKQDKIIEGVLFLLRQAHDGSSTLTAGGMATVMFLADKGHLDAYGRPVFFDNYIATANGPVGVKAAEMLDAAFDWSTTDAVYAPWTRGAPEDEQRLRATREPNLRRLSRSDVDALTNALSTFTSLDVEQLKVFTHRQKAYLEAWRDGAGVGERLDPRLVPDERDDEMIDDLLYASRHAFVAKRRP